MLHQTWTNGNKIEAKFIKDIHYGAGLVRLHLQGHETTSTLRSNDEGAPQFLNSFKSPIIPKAQGGARSFSLAAPRRFCYAKLGRTSSFWPGVTMRSFPADQTLSLISTLKVIGEATVCDQRQVRPSTQASGTPCSHVRPEPWPRRKTALPKPTSILTSMVVRAPELDFGAIGSVRWY